MQKNSNVKAMSQIEKLPPELQKAIKEIAETIRPIIDDIHSKPATTQNYYGDYMRILSYKPNHKKTLAVAMLYLGCNPLGIEAAVKNV